MTFWSQFSVPALLAPLESQRSAGNVGGLNLERACVFSPQQAIYCTVHIAFSMLVLLRSGGHLCPHWAWGACTRLPALHATADLHTATCLPDFMIVVLPATACPSCRFCSYSCHQRGPSADPL